MNKRINCIMLIDDNSDDNFFHERVIRKCNVTDTIVVKQTGMEALEYLKNSEKQYPDLIFLDINMPGMNGWEFLEEFAKLESRGGSAIIVMLTSSEDPKEKNKMKEVSIPCDFKTKPLTNEILTEVIDKYC